ncbi:MAG: hypothetical protein JXR39_10445 [Marinilabiliaceae bacterium]|nr:hypothetical protein [Marinilabiliaceae bacterium]
MQRESQFFSPLWGIKMSFFEAASPFLRVCFGTASTVLRLRFDTASTRSRSGIENGTALVRIRPMVDGA